MHFDWNKVEDEIFSQSVKVGKDSAPKCKRIYLLKKVAVTEKISATTSIGKKYMTQFYKRQAKFLPNKQKNMLKRSLKSIE